MKNKSSLLTASLLLALLSAQAQAQRSYQPEKFYNPTVSTTSKLLPQPGMHKSTAKTTGTATRLLATAYYGHDGSNFKIADSVRYTYGGDRGRIPDQYALADIIQDWVPGAAAGSFANNFKTINTYNSANNPLTQTIQQWNGSSASWTDYSRDVYSYDASSGNTLNILEQSWDGSAWQNNRQTGYTYDASSRRSTQTIQNWNAGAASWSNSSRNSFDYISSTSLISSNLLQTWNAGAGTWQDAERTSSTYNSKGRELIATNERYDSDSSAWESAYRYTTVYDASDTQEISRTDEWYKSFPTPGWYNMSKTTFTWSSLGKINSWMEQNWDETTKSWINVSRGQNTFNTKGLFDVNTTDNWNAASNTWEFTNMSYQFRYYYEDFTLGIPETAVRNGSIKLFPVPASNELNIDLQWQDKQAFSVAIYDIQGRIWQQWHMPAASTYTDRVNIESLPAGNYLIKFSGEGNGAILQQLTVVR